MYNIKIYPYLILLIITSALLSCQRQSANESANQSTIETKTQPLPEVLSKGITAHGGLAKWNQMHTLEYEILRNEKKEHHLINLKNRKVLLTHEDYKLGFDGKDVWITPDIAAFGKGSPRFYHNLIFYFYAMPFVLADPGINYEILPQKTIQGKKYNRVKIRYDAGVGDTPKDYYIAHFNAETNLMDWLLYTVTYFSKEESEKYNALHYDWQEVNGLKVPIKMTGYHFENDSIGNQRYERPFKNVKLKQEPVKDSIFEKPSNAEIDPLVN